MGIGSASPLASIRMWSTRSTSLRTTSRRSVRTDVTQQMQPLLISMISSSEVITSSESMSTSPNSFSITATRRPCCSRRM